MSSSSAEFDSGKLGQFFQRIDSLKDEERYETARREADRFWEENRERLSEADSRCLVQAWAQCFYQDESLRKDEARDGALGTLDRFDPPQRSTDPETLGLAGAIWKRSWQASGQRVDLETAANYYVKGFELAGLQDGGYAAINAAFLLDMRAAQEQKSQVGGAAAAAEIETVHTKARTLRERIVAELGPTPPRLAERSPEAGWWAYATLAEALFGLGRYGEAGDALKAGLAKEPRTRELDSTARQLSAIACMHGYGTTMPPGEADRVQKTLRDLLGVAVDPSSVLRGKVGLALSGGGFRASFFHIGVLARLAEVDALRHVEALSCVSGGSILGAYYYLKVQRLLEENADTDLGPAHYVALILEIEREFLESVQKNIRVRVARNLFKNLKIAFTGYSRTHRTAELMDEILFNERNVPRSRLESRRRERGPRMMSELLIYPNGDESFHPAPHNWRRNNKVPILILNATTLNTCHQWQFTASWMGEPPEGASGKIDGNPRLRRMYYHEAPNEHRRTRLSFAVAASASVPGVFEPLPLRNLYPGMTLRLADGGVYDNQGTASLIEQDCNVLLVSDASGHQGQETNPASDILGNLFRSSSVSLARVREAQYLELAARKRSSLARALMFVHLRQDLQPGEVGWIDCSDETVPAQPPTSLTAYGIRRDLQDKIARVRTDLDAFNDLEASAIALSGYRMATEALKGLSTEFPGPAAMGNWRFLEVGDALSDPGAPLASKLERVLDASSQIAFKVWRLSLALTAIGIALVAAALVGLFAVAFLLPDGSLLTRRGIALAILSMVAAGFVGGFAVKALNWKGTAQRIVVGFGLVFFGWIAANLHLWIFDPIYLRIGKAPSRGLDIPEDGTKAS